MFRVLIASPSDVSEERETAVKIVQEWNDLNSPVRQVVVLPLRWETHSVPEYGRRPQEVINRQIVDHADLLIGIFWTRIGSPTGEAESGTLEEIERVASAGKPVMLYFSQVKQDPERIDIDQLKILREFRTKTFPNALVETFSDLIGFRDKLTRQLEMQIRSLISQEGAHPNEPEPPPVTDIRIEFADPSTGEALGREMSIDVTNIHIPNRDDIPDYEEEPEPKSQDNGSLMSLGLLNVPNKDYYREYIAYLWRRAVYRPVIFRLLNVGGVGARDVYVDVNIAGDQNVMILPNNGRVLSPPSKAGLNFPLFNPEETIKKIGESWSTSIEIRALQPQRAISPPGSFLIGATQDATATVHARIYADTLPQPVTASLKINLKVDQTRQDALVLLRMAEVA